MKLYFRKALSLLLAFTMLATMFVYMDMGGIDAEATISNSTPTRPSIKFYVPETIYLKPSSTTAFQYYANISNTGTVVSTPGTTGNVYFYCSGGSNIQVKCSGTNIGTLTASGTTLNTSISGKSLSSALSEGATRLLTWTATYTYGGKTHTAKAYSVAYRTPQNEVAAGVRQKNDYSTATQSQGLFWIRGMHSFSGGDKQCTLNLFTDSPPTSNTAVNDKFSDPSGLNGGSKLVSDDDKNNGGHNESATAGTALLTVDYSRYTNLNQIPTLRLGFWQMWTADDNNKVNNGYIKYSLDGSTITLASSEFTDFTVGSVYGAPTTAEPSGGKPLDYAHSSTGTKTFAFSAKAYTTRGSRYINNEFFFDLKVTYVNKSSLRNALQSAINSGRQSSDYTSTSWNSYVSGMEAAAANLGNPTSTTTSYSIPTPTRQTYTATCYHKLPVPTGASGYVNGTLTADSADGSTDGYITKTETKTFNSGDTVTWSKNSYTGYSTSTGNSTGTATGNLSKTFIYTAASYSVSWNANGGSPTTSTTNKYNETYNLPSNPSRTGYRFAGWYTAKSGGSQITSSTRVIITSGTTYYAHWNVNTYTVKYWRNYDSNDQTATATTSHTYNVAKALVSNSTYSKTGYRLTAWGTTRTGGTTYSPGQSVSNLTSTHGATVNLYAQWTANTYTVKYWRNHTSTDSTATVTATHTFNVSKALEPNSTYSKTGYSLTSWNKARDGSSTSYTPGNNYTNLTSTHGGTVNLYAQWTPRNYTITWIADGVQHAQTTATYDSTYNLPASNPSKTGHTFTGWYTASSGGTQITGSTTVSITSNTTYYAHFSANSYTVTWSGNGGSPSSTTTSATYGSTYTLPSNPSRTGYTFTGWYTGASSGTQITGSTTVSITANTTYYAHWTANTYTVTWSGNGGSPSSTTTSATYGSTYSLPSNPSRTGYTFTGWYTGASSGTQITGSTTVSITANTTYYAHWSAKTYTVTWNGNGGSPTSTTTSATYDSTYSLPSDPTRTGYTFTGWYTAVSGGTEITGSTTVSITANTTYYAHWSVNTYTVTWSGNGGSPSSATTSATYGSTYTLPSNPSRTGYTFTGWYTGASSGTQITGSTTVSITANTTYYAHWSVNTYSVVYYQNHNASDNTTTSVTHTYDAAKALEPSTTFSKTGYTFVEWNTARAGSGTTYDAGQSVINLASGQGDTFNLYAIWSENSYTLTFDGNGGKVYIDTVLVDMGSEDYGYSQVLNSLANTTLPERQGYIFTGYKQGSTQITTNLFDGTWVNEYYNGTGNFVNSQTAVRTDYIPVESGKTYKISNYSGSINAWVLYNSSKTYVADVATNTSSYTASQDGYIIVAFNDGVPSASRTRFVFEESLGTYGSVFGTNPVTLAAQWSPISYYVSYDSNGGSGTTATTQHTYDTVSALATNQFTRFGFHFTGWSTSASGGTTMTQANNLTTVSDATVKLYAIWAANTYTVNFLGNYTAAEGEVSDAVATGQTSKVFTYNQSNSLAGTVYERDGFTLLGWESSASDAINKCIAIGEGASITPTYTLNQEDTFNYTSTHGATINLYALWSPNAYRVSYNSNNGSGTMADTQHYYGIESTLRANTFIRAGYTFEGWSTTQGGSVEYADGAVVTTLTTSSTIMLYAVWAPKTYNVTWDANGGTPAIQYNTVTYNSPYTAPTEPTLTGYTFNGWWNDDEVRIGLTAGNQTIYNPSNPSDHTLEARWTTNEYTVTFNTDGGSSVSDMTLDYNDTFTFPTTTKTGHTFVGWYDNSSFSGTSYASGDTGTVGASNVTYYAKWSVNEYTIRFNADGGEFSDSSTVKDVTANYGEAITAPANPTRAGYTFSKWEDSYNATYTVPTTMPNYGADGTIVEITAVWTINYVTISFDTQGGTSVAPISGNYGTTVTAPTAPTKTGYSFVEWRMGSTEGAVYDFTVNTTIPAADVTLYAIWSINEYTVSYNITGDTSGTTISSQTEEYGTGITLSDGSGLIVDNEVAQEYRTFLGWSTTQGATTVEYAPSASYTISDNNVTMYAVWSANYYELNELVAAYWNFNDSELVGPLPVSATVDAQYYGASYDVDYFTDATTTALATAIQESQESQYRNLPQSQQNAVNGLRDAITTAIENLALKPVDLDYEYDCPYMNELGEHNQYCDGTHSYNEIKTLSLNAADATIGGRPVYLNTGDLEYMVGEFDTLISMYPKIPDQYMIFDYVVNLASMYHSLTPNTADTSDLQSFVYAHQNNQYYTDVYYTEGTLTPYLDEVSTVTTAVAAKGGYSGFTIFEQDTVDGYLSTLQTYQGNLVPQKANEYDTVIAKISILIGESSLGGYEGYSGYTGDPIAFGTQYNGLDETLRLHLESAYTATTVSALQTAINAVNWGYTELDTLNATIANDIINYATAIETAISELERNTVNCTVYHYFQDANSTETYVENSSYTSDESVTPNTTYNAITEGWVVDVDGFTINESKGVEVAVGTEAASLVLYYDRNEYNLTFDSNGGNEVDLTGVRYGATVTLPIPTKEGYTFCGWFEDESFNTEISLSNVSRTSSPANNEYGECLYIVSGVVPNWGEDAAAKTLYAKWGANTDTEYKVEHYKQNLNGTYPITATDTTQHTGTTGAEASVYPLLQSYEGFYFNDSVTGTVTTETISGDGSTVLKAYYTRNTYTVTFHANGGTLTDNSEQTVIYEGLLTEPSAPERENYDFLGWYTESTAENEFDLLTTPVTGTMTLYAGWKETLADYSELEDRVEYVEINENYALENPTTPVVDGSGVEQTNINLYTAESYSAYLTAKQAVDIELANPTIPISEQYRVDDLLSALNTAIANLEYAPAEYSYLEATVTQAEAVDLNVNHIAYKGETTPEELVSTLDTALNDVEEGKNASEQATVNGYTTSIATAMSDIVPYEDDAQPKLSVYEIGTDIESYAQDKAELQSVLTSNDYGDIGYVFPGKGYYTYYCYTNSINPVILMDIQDIADSTGRVSYPANIDMTQTVSDAQKVTPATMQVGSEASSAPLSAGDNRYSCMLLTPEFTKGYNDKQYAVYTVKVTDDGLNPNEPSTMELKGADYSTSEGEVAYGTTTNEAVTPEGYITIYVEYRNSMSVDEYGEYVDDGRDPNSLRVVSEISDEQTDVWAPKGTLYRTSGGIDSIWNFVTSNDSAYIFNDPNYGKAGLGCFYYFLDTTKDTTIIDEFNAGNISGATQSMISAINSNLSEYEESLNDYPQGSWSIHYTEQKEVNKNLVYVHMVDRWGNVFNRIIRLANIDATRPEIAVTENGGVTVTENGRSGVNELKIYEYAYEGSTTTLASGRFALKSACDQQWITDSMLNSGNNMLRIKPEGAEGTSRYTLQIIDKAGHSAVKTVFTDAEGYLNITLIDEFNDVGEGGGAQQNSTTSEMYSFGLNEQYTVNLNAPLSTVKEVEAAEGAVVESYTTLSINVGEGVDKLNVEDTSNGAIKTFTTGAEGVTVTDNADGTYTWDINLYLSKLETVYRVTARTYGVWEDVGLERSVLCTTQAGLEAQQPLISATGQTVNVGEAAEITIVTSADVDRVRLIDENNMFRTYTMTNSTIELTDNGDGTMTWVIPYRMNVVGEYNLDIAARVGSQWEPKKLSTIVEFV